MTVGNIAKPSYFSIFIVGPKGDGFVIFSFSLYICSVMWEIEVKNKKFYPWPISLSVGEEQVFLSKEDAEKMISELKDAISSIDTDSD